MERRAWRIKIHKSEIDRISVTYEIVFMYEYNLDCSSWFFNYFLEVQGAQRKERKNAKERQRVVAEVSRGIITVIQIERQRNVIYHDFLDNHGGWHLKILPLIIAPAARYCENKESSTNREKESRVSILRDRKVKWARQPLGTRDISPYNREPAGCWLFDPNVGYKRSSCFFPYFFHFEISINTLAYI